MHLRWSSIALVFVGGAIGTGLREAVSLAIPVGGGVPVAIFCINVSGAFALGLLLETLLRRGPDEGVRRGIRLFVGTGVLGGFTTYSALANDTELLFRDGQGWIGAGYAVATVIVGGLASLLGIWVGGVIGRSRDVRATRDAGAAGDASSAGDAIDGGRAS